ncbi:uncharacterized protein BCR38DRAFT_314970, partial [Pseudomassariella vexata]
QSRQPELFAALSLTWGTATIALVLRLVARRITRISLSWDDYLAIAAYVTKSWGWSLTHNAGAQVGFGLLLKDTGLPPEQALRDARRDLYIDELCYAFSLACSKFAILALYWRMFSTSAIRISIIVLAVCSLIWLMIRTFLTVFQCVPVKAFWDKTVPDAVCIVNEAYFFLGTVIVHLLLDLTIMALPVVQIWKIKLTASRKIGVMILFLFGIIVCSASSVVIIFSFQYHAEELEMSWNVAWIFIWATIEVNLAVVSACLPMLRPLFTE